MHTANGVGYCLEGHDLALAKLAAYRPKDKDFVRTLLVEGLVQASVLHERLASLPVDEERAEAIKRWLSVTEADLLF